MTREAAIAYLFRMMEDESEVNWASSWAHDHEHMLWASVVGDRPEAVRGAASEPVRLRELATLANGWFVWSDEANDVEFVPLERWLAMYAEYKAARQGGTR